MGRAIVPALALALVLGSAGCGEPPGRDAGVDAPRITSSDAPSPILEGTVVRLTGVSLDRLGTAPVLRVTARGATYELSSVPHDDDASLLFEVSGTLVESLGSGRTAVDLEISGDGVTSDVFLTTWEIATDLTLSVEAAPSGDVHRNDVAVLRGAGFVSETEGTTEACFDGTFTRDGGPSAPLEACLPVSLLERTSRDRGVVVLSTALGGIWPGTFDGTMSVTSTLRGGAVRTADPIATTLRFGRPELFSLSPTMASLGQVLVVRGAGFVGGASETTILRIEGTFTPPSGTAAAFGPEEIVPAFVSGDEVRMSIEAELQGEALVARLFGAARGAFTGTAVPIAIAGTDEVAGEPVPFGFVLGPIVQVVHLRFLPGFYSSLDHFGLGSAAGTIEEGIARRIEDLYEGLNVQVRLDEPEDFDPRAYSVVEIGGPDPNGNGLFGYDNSPGKDIGNLRLFDRIGGANAETQMDGYPGYGGVFVESLLWWSEHPDLPVARPPSSPDPEPLFDEIFDPVRAQPATLAEIEGVGDSSRVAAVSRALDALASIIGETTAHELGHSFGMAQPYGGATAFHNEVDGDGCLMDRGGDRPLGERAQQPGFARTSFCYDEVDYLTEILAP